MPAKRLLFKGGGLYIGSPNEKGGLMGVYSDGSAHQTTFGSITTSYFSPQIFRQS
jgi:hypothetical protein